jgi:DNA-binding NtrC family response regulator
MDMARILVVDDEANMAKVVARSLERRGHEVICAGDGSEALKRLAESDFALVLSDQRMEPMNGMELLSRVRRDHPSTALIMMTAYGEVEHAVAAMRAGAAHYLNKPIDLDELNVLAEKVLEENRLRRDHGRLRQVLARQSEDWDLVGQSDAMREVRDLVLRVAPTDATVLVRGETGTGKELTARAVHKHSQRAQGAFVAVNCAALPDTLLESELFGYMKGAFTGADADKTGLFELANGGTIFLDELGEANPAVQSKLLRVLAERRFLPVGGHREVEVDVRIVSATNQDLEELIRQGRFREDLFYRFNVFPIDLPPLRHRLEDLPGLARALLHGLGATETSLPESVLAQLRTYPWPGNVRELRNVLERGRILAQGAPLAAEHIVLPRARGAKGDEVLDLNLDNNERRLILAALERASGNKTRAAELLGLTRRALYSRMERLDLPLRAGEDV